jgi:hypothetical protein
LSGGPLDAGLRDWAAHFGAAAEADTVYAEKLAFLKSLGGAELQQYVSGKLIIDQIQQDLPVAPGRGRPLTADLKDRYMDKALDPPPDLAALIDRILLAAAAERSA